LGSIPAPSDGCPILRVSCEGWDSQVSPSNSHRKQTCSLGDLGVPATTVRVEKPTSQKEQIRFVVGAEGRERWNPTLRKEREGWGTRRMGRGQSPKVRSLHLYLPPASEFAQKRDLGHPLKFSKSGCCSLKAHSRSDFNIARPCALRGLQSGGNAEAGRAVIDVHVRRFIVPVVEHIGRLGAKLKLRSFP